MSYCTFCGTLKTTIPETQYRKFDAATGALQMRLICPNPRCCLEYGHDPTWWRMICKKCGYQCSDA